MAQGALGCRDKAPFMLFIETLGQADPPPVPEPFSRQNSGLEAGTQEFSCICRQAGLPAAGPACGRSAVLILQLHDAPPPPLLALLSCTSSRPKSGPRACCGACGWGCGEGP